MKWVEALKIFNRGKGMWCIAKKGSPEYDEVKKIMNSTKPEVVEARNVERRAKATEQLKEVASKAEVRREEAKKKYAEKLTEMESQKKEAEKMMIETGVKIGDKSEIIENKAPYFLTKGYAEITSIGFGRFRDEPYVRVSIHETDVARNTTSVKETDELYYFQKFLPDGLSEWSAANRDWKRNQIYMTLHFKTTAVTKRGTLDSDIRKVDRFTTDITSMKQIKVGSVLFNPKERSQGIKHETITDLFYIVTKKNTTHDSILVFRCDITPNPAEVPDGYKGKFSARRRFPDMSYDEKGEEWLSKHGSELTFSDKYGPPSVGGIDPGRRLKFGKMIESKYL